MLVDMCVDIDVDTLIPTFAIILNDVIANIVHTIKKELFFGTYLVNIVNTARTKLKMRKLLILNYLIVVDIYLPS